MSETAEPYAYRDEVAELLASFTADVSGDLTPAIRHAAKRAQRKPEIREDGLEPFHESNLSGVVSIDRDAFVAHTLGAPTQV